MLLLNHSSDIWRKVAVGTNGRKVLQSLYTGVDALFLPLVKPVSVEIQFSLGRDYSVYMDVATDVQVGDQLVYNGDKFNVRTVSVFDVPDVGHKELIATKDSV